jgi:hypothetical protein
VCLWAVTLTLPARSGKDLLEMCPISKYVNSRARHCAGRPPKPNHALRAFIAAKLLREGWFGIKTITATSLLSGISRPSIQAAVLLLQCGDDALVTDVLNGRQPLIRAANRVRNRAKLIEDFRQASPEDRAAFGHAVGVAALFDSAVAPSL